MTSAGSTRGSVTLEIAILGPVLLLLIFTIIQVGLWSYARSLALAAAQEGVAAGRAYGAPNGAAGASADRFLAECAGDSLVDPVVHATRQDGDLVVRVTGRSLSVLPGVPGLAVGQSAQAPFEEFTTP